MWVTEQKLSDISWRMISPPPPCPLKPGWVVITGWIGSLGISASLCAVFAPPRSFAPFPCEGSDNQGNCVATVKPLMWQCSVCRAELLAPAAQQETPTVRKLQFHWAKLHFLLLFLTAPGGRKDASPGAQTVPHQRKTSAGCEAARSTESIEDVGFIRAGDTHYIMSVSSTRGTDSLIVW